MDATTIVAVSFLALSARGPAQEPAGAPLFEERELAGVRTVCGGPEKDYIVEVNGGGLALSDFDGDGDFDLVVVDGSTLAAVRAGEPGRPPRLFLNDGAAGFAPAGEAWAMAGGRWGMGCAAGDLNSDGHPDLIVTEWGRDRVFLNRGGAGFEEVTEGAGLEGERWGTSAALLDYDGDGALDLAVINYLAFDPDLVAARGAGDCRWKGHDVMCGPEGLTPVHDQLYRGKGDGSFEEVSVKAGFRPEQAGFGLGVTTLDYDDDGDTDLYVSNDSTPNFLWENQGDGTFREVGYRRSVSHDAGGREQAGMGIGCADLNGDGRQDLLVTNFSGETNALYVSRPGGSYRERASTLGLGGPGMTTLGWGAVLEDFDLDGRVDGAIMNGHVYPQADQPGTDTSYAQPDHLFLQGSDGRFELAPLSRGAPRVSRASAAADLDGDGDLDLVALELDGAVRVLVNRARQPGDDRARDDRVGDDRVGNETGPGWLRVRLSARGGNVDALGARVVAEWEGGQRLAEVRTAGGYQASVPPEVHFGLGAAHALRRLTIRWPSGAEQVLEDLPADRLLVVEEPE